MSRIRKRTTAAYRAVHRQFSTTALILSILALVLALAGGAYAASSGGKLSSKQKKEVEKIAKRYAGKPGANGAPGERGLQGESGKPGENGKGGSNGTPAEAFTFASGHGCSKGGVEVKSASAAQYLCNGEPGEPGEPGADGNTVLHGTTPPSNSEGSKGDFYIDTQTSEIFGPKGETSWPTPGTSLEGSPWTAGGTLPPGKTEQGTWFLSGEAAAEFSQIEAVSISFPIPLAAPLNNETGVSECGEAEGHRPCQVVVVTYGLAPPECPGTVAAPAAKPGTLCVYINGASNVFKYGPSEDEEVYFVKVKDVEAEHVGESGHEQPYEIVEAAGRSGALISAYAAGAGPVKAFGTWAVTAEEP